MHGTGRTSATDISLQLNIPMVEVDLSEHHYDDAARFALPHIHTALRRCKRGFATVAWYDPHSMDILPCCTSHNGVIPSSTRRITRVG